MLDVHVARENLRFYIVIANLVVLKLGPTSAICVKLNMLCNFLTHSNVDFTRDTLIMSEEGWVRDRKLAAGGHSKLQSSFPMSVFVEKNYAFCVQYVRMSVYLPVKMYM